jgi:hypothetical protein
MGKQDHLLDPRDVRRRQLRIDRDVIVRSSWQVHPMLE